MKPHIKNWLKYFKISPEEWFPCECGCERRAEQWHHLIPRSSFGSKRKKEQDRVENVAYINHDCHEKAGASKAFNDELKVKHRHNLLKCSNNTEDLVRLTEKGFTLDETEQIIGILTTVDTTYEEVKPKN